jgi:hypothetical protein
MSLNPRMTVTRRIRRRGEREVRRKTIARGMPGDFRRDRGDYARVPCFIIAREAAGASSARHSLRPLISEGVTFRPKLAWNARRDREAVSCDVRLFEILNLWEFVAREKRIIRRPRLVRNCARERGPITTGVDCQEAVYRRCEIVRPRRMGPCVRRDD